MPPEKQRGPGLASLDLEKECCSTKNDRTDSVTGDRYAGMTFRMDFADHNIRYIPSDKSASDCYEAAEPMFNAGEIELVDVAKLQEQLLTLVVRGAKVTHQPGDHDDYAARHVAR
jgi:hypothetical protein